MDSTSAPNKISLPFADSGAKNTIPVASQIGITNGAASYTDGFPPLTRTPIVAGGIPPFGTDMNGILNAITDIQQWQSAGSGFKYDSTFSTAIGGYPKGARLLNAAATGEWFSTVENNTTNPDTGGAGWVPIPLPATIQASAVNSAVAGGTADAITGVFSPVIAALPAAPATLFVRVRAVSLNATATPTFKADGTAAKAIVKYGNTPLVAGDISGAGHWLELQFDAVLDKWVLLNPAYANVFPQAGVLVTQFGAKGDGITDDSTAIQAAINYLQNGSGGRLLFPNLTYYISAAGLSIGDATGAGSPNNTKAPVSLEGIGAVSGVGFNSPSNCAIIKSNVAGPAIKFNATLGWGLKNFAFTFTTASTAAMAYQAYEVQSGNAENITVLNCPGLVHVDLETWGVHNLTFNNFRNHFIYMNTSPANAVGIKLDGPGTGGNVAFNTFDGLHVQPGVSTHIGVQLGFADTNLFLRYDCNPLGSGFANAIKFDYSSGGFPNYNTFVGGDPYNNQIISSGSPTFPLSMANNWKGFPLGNNAPIPSAVGFTIDKIKLSGNATFYVSSAGSTSSFGIYSGNPCQTVQQAYDQIAKYFDLAGNTVTINVANATYSAGLNATQKINGWNGPNSVVIAGGGGSTVFSTGSNSCFRAAQGTGFEVQSCNLTNSASASAVFADGGMINVGTGVVFGGVGASHKQASLNGRIADVGAHFINGSPGLAHYDARSGGVINASSQTITLLGNITVSKFANVRDGNISTSAMIYTLGAFTVTGSRYFAELNGVIDTNSGGANYFPGNSAGTTATGGQYA